MMNPPLTQPQLNSQAIKKIDKDDLRLSLITNQYALRETRLDTDNQQPTGLLILVNGKELAGKGAAVTQLRQWIDPRLLKVEATVGQSPLTNQPIWQAHSKVLPRHGNVMVYFGNWYADLIYEVMQMRLTGVNQEQWQDYLQQQLQCLQAFEKDLIANDTKILKCWFDIDQQTLIERLNDDTPDPTNLYHIDWTDSEVVTQFDELAAQILTKQHDWVVIDNSDANHKNDDGDNKVGTLIFCQYVLASMQTALQESQQIAQQQSQHGSKANKAHKKSASGFKWAEVPDKLTDIDDPDMDKAEYKAALVDKQAQLAKLLRQRYARQVIFVFEGMDAAGKGGAIKRLVAPLDPREYQIYNIAAPTDIEFEHPYLWRFWTRLPQQQHCYAQSSRIAIFDRSWYGRVLVERIEDFASTDEWQRAYDEINRFEADLTDNGAIIIKYWLAIDKKEQLERFEDRRDTPHKQFKLTDDDWRNRDKWKDYVQAASDMLARTHQMSAPWHMVATNDKRTARLMVLDYAIKQLTKSLGSAEHSSL